MKIEELYEKYNDKSEENSTRGYYAWQIKIFNRIREKIKDDEEALVLFNHTLDFAEMKSYCAD